MALEETARILVLSYLWEWAPAGVPPEAAEVLEHTLLSSRLNSSPDGSTQAIAEITWTHAAEAGWSDKPVTCSNPLGQEPPGL